MQLPRVFNYVLHFFLVAGYEKLFLYLVGVFAASQLLDELGGL
jgi:hypothetical protein